MGGQLKRFSDKFSKTNKGMASLTCALSNEVPDCPVESPVSGQVFEKRLIEKYVTEAGVDPINKEPLTIEQLIEVKCSPLVKPKPPSATSIPAILKPQAVAGTPLMHTPSHAPPTPGHDQAQQVAAGGASTQEASGMNGDIVEKLQEKATVLTQERKRRGKTVPEDLCTAEKIKEFVSQSSHPGLHSASVPGILSVDISPADTAKILTGGADKNATVFNKDLEQVVAVLKGHTKKVNRVVFHPTEDIVITGSHDSTVRVWNVPNSSTTSVLRVHDGPVTGLSLHATGDYVLTTSTDQHWAFSDIRAGRLVTRVQD